MMILFYVLVFKVFVLLAPYVCFHIFSWVKVTEWPPIGKIAAHSAYDMFSWYKYLIVNLVFSHLGFWSENLFLIAPFLDLCLLAPILTLTVAWFQTVPLIGYFAWMCLKEGVYMLTSSRTTYS